MSVKKHIPQKRSTFNLLNYWGLNLYYFKILLGTLIGVLSNTETIQAQNSVSSVQVNVEGVKTKDAANSLGANDGKTIFNYVDGLGRLIQTVEKETSPGFNDLVIPKNYDHRGRVVKRYLPYVSDQSGGSYKPNALVGNYTNSDQYQFYQTADKVSHDTKPYSERIFEKSPLSNLLEQGGTGSTWNATSTEHTMRYDYKVNSANEVRKIYVQGGLPVLGTYYAAGQLIMSETQDEDDNYSYEYHDKLGRLIMKKSINEADELITYFVYNDKNQLAFVIPPEEAKDIFNGATIDSDFADQRLFRYTYDGRGRVITREVPDAGEERFVYDHRDRMVLRQTAEQRKRNEWTYIKYDQLDRIVFTGIYTSGDSFTELRDGAHPEGFNPESIQENIVTKAYDSNVEYTAKRSITLQPGFAYDAHTDGPKIFQLKSGSVIQNEDGQYIDNLFPNVDNGERHTVNYYDTYDFNRDGTLDYTFNTLHNTYLSSNPSPVYTVRGKLTRNFTKVLDDDIMLVSLYFYNDKGRVIQMQTENHKGGTDYVTMEYDFSGKIMKSVTTYDNPSSSSGKVTVIRRMEYDHAGRITKVYHQVNTQPEVLLCSFSYNELGQLVDEKIHSEDGGNTFLQSIDYRYNIRGWLTSINNANLADDDGVTNNETDDLFGMELLYQNAVTGHEKFNGSPGEMKWADAHNDKQESYKYTYDAMNRLTDAEYGKNADYSVNTYDVSAIDYDLNGNILSLKRNNEIDGSLETIDDLVYNYSNNKLNAVNDVSPYEEGFHDRFEGANEYDYDANGNMIQDLNKGMVSVVYNHLDKPTSVDFSDGKTVKYKYDANGKLLTQEYYNSDKDLVKTKDFIGDMVYDDNELSMLRTTKGHVIMKDLQDPEYQYNLTDHLGNTRVTVTEKPQSFEYLATMESENEEQEVFLNIEATRVPMALANHTAGGNEAARVNSDTPVGPAIAFYVAPGDEVDLETYAYYEGGSGYSNSISASVVINALTTPALIAGSLEALGASTISNGINEAITSIGVTGSSDDEVPAGYLNYILFDKNFEYLSFGFVQVSSAADGSLEYLSLSDVNVTEEGYMLVYVSNESDVSNFVHFDDIKVTHQHTSKIVQQQDYYPFGLACETYRREGAAKNPYLYNKASRLEEETEWYDTPYRKYDASIGRFTGVDPLADHMPGISGYHYAYNNPVSFNDPLGLQPNKQIGYKRNGGGGGSVVSSPKRQGWNLGTNWSDHRSVEMNAGLMSTSAFREYYGLDDGYGGTDYERAGQLVDELVASGSSSVIRYSVVGVNGLGDGSGTGNIVPGTESYRLYLDDQSGGSGAQTEISEWLFLAGLAAEPLKDLYDPLTASNRELVKTAVKDGHPAKIKAVEKVYKSGLKFGKVVRVAGGIVVIAGVANDAIYGFYYASQGDASQAKGSFATAGAGIIAAGTGPAGLIWYGLNMLEGYQPHYTNYSNPLIVPSDNTSVVPNRIIR